jgi:hypothetical protein
MAPLLDTPALIAQAVLAPSSHNTQPWLFATRDNHIELLADRTRALPVNDPNNRELIISCGCALMNLRVAAAHQHLHAAVDTFPDGEQSDLLARVTLTAGDADSSDAHLFTAIEKRRTYRKRFSAQRVTPLALDALKDAAQWPGVRLHLLAQDDQRQAAAALVAQADKDLWSNPHWRRELAAWMRPRQQRDGLPVPGYALALTQMLLRNFNLGGGQAAKNYQLALHSPVLALLCTDADTGASWLTAGQALQKLLLTAVGHNLQALYLNQAVQVPSTRKQLAALAGKNTRYPQILVCLGTPAEPAPAKARRAVAEVMV